MGAPNKSVNRWHLLGNYMRRKTTFPQLPGSLVIEATNRCPMNCIMCPSREAASHPCDMSLELFRRIIDQSETAVEFIDFSFRGEPLLNKDIFAMIDYAKTRGLSASLQTNGMLLDEKACRALLELKLDLLTVSIDAMSAETYNKIRKGGDFNLVIENVKRIIEMKRQMKSETIISAQLIPMAENENEVKDFKKFWKSYQGISARLKPFSRRCGVLNDDLASLKEENAQPRHNRCSRIWNSMFIYADGTVVPCCNDFLCQYPLGNLNTQSVAEVWNGRALVDLRRKHAEGSFDDLSLCRSCGLLRTSYYKHLATFLFDGLSLRRSLITFDLSY